MVVAVFYPTKKNHRIGIFPVIFTDVIRAGKRRFESKRNSKKNRKIFFQTMRLEHDKLTACLSSRYTCIPYDKTHARQLKKHPPFLRYKQREIVNRKNVNKPQLETISSRKIPSAYDSMKNPWTSLRKRLYCQR